MRDIKFRGFAVEELIGSQWVYGFGVYECHYTDGTSDIFLYTESSPIVVNKGSVGQYTGLKDYKGNEIYEGATMKREYVNPLTNDSKIDLFTVEYSDRSGIYRLKHEKHSYYDSCIMFINEKWEVVEDNQCPELAGEK